MPNAFLARCRYLSGLIAGSTANKIGYVAAFPIPEVLRGINAFTLGVGPKLNPTVRHAADMHSAYLRHALNCAETALDGGPASEPFCHRSRRMDADVVRSTDRKSRG